MEAHARGAETGKEGSWCGGEWRVEKMCKVTEKKVVKTFRLFGREFWRVGAEMASYGPAPNIWGKNVSEPKIWGVGG
jgi:hypothetical protein